MAEFHIIREYPHRPETVWRALTDPDLVPRWTATGRGGRPEGFVAEVGRRFRYVGKPVPGWNGIVECEVLAVEPPVMLQHTWQGGKQEPSLVTWRIEPIGTSAGPGPGPGSGPGSGTASRLTYDHTGLRGVDGFIMATFVLGPIRRRMLTTGLPPVLDAIDGPVDGTVRPGSPRG
jgi:activator of Hsp90 ATPase-like protein